jgi:hypothetical protein
MAIMFGLCNSQFDALADFASDNFIEMRVKTALITHHRASIWEHSA